MSEAIIIALVSGGVTVILAVISIAILLITNKNNREVAAIAASNSVELARITSQQHDMNEKVDDYHREVDGKMTQLLEAKEAVGIAKGKEEQKIESASIASETVEAIKADPNINVNVS